MAASLFISYSRREAPFVDSLFDALDDRGFKVWLDYHKLVPAKPWAGQIDKGIVDAEITLLVVSKESLASKYVELEWRRAIELKKRIILVIFEAVKLPDVLLGYEWVDFRRSFKKGLEILLTHIAAPATINENPPQSGFKAPPIVWITFGVSVIIALFSIPAIWSLYLPFYLFPLPYRILKRDFNYFRVQLAVFLLPVMLLFSDFIFPQLGDSLFILVFFSIFLAPLLFFLLQTSGMYRWGKPIATRRKFANPYVPEGTRPEPIRFVVDFAPEDKKYADEIVRVLKKHGHPHIESSHDAQAAFVLVSNYKNTTTLDPETQSVYPIILQAAPDIDPKLQRVQWIDFRHGLKHLDKLALLLCEPEKMLKALSISPPGEQVVLPTVIQSLVYFVTITSILGVGGWIGVIRNIWTDLSQTGSFLGVIITLAIAIGGGLLLLWNSTQSLIHRRGRLATYWGLGFWLLCLGILNFIQFIMAGALIDMIPGYDIANDFRTLGGMIGSIAYVGGLAILLLILLWNWKDLLRWFPHKMKQTKSTA